MTNFQSAKVKVSQSQSEGQNESPTASVGDTRLYILTR